MNWPELPASYSSSRDALHRVAVHVLARGRATRSGKFGLRATPGGIGTPAFGPDLEVLRVSGLRLIREVTGASAQTTSLDLSTATLAEAAQFAGVDLIEPFEAGSDTPPVGDASESFDFDVAGLQVLADWFAFGATGLDAVMSMVVPAGNPSVVQLWPEHFDLGCDVPVGGEQVDGERRFNLGASPGDAFLDEPYLYVGPWDEQRPGEPEYWNAPFGAVLGYGELREADDPHAGAVDFYRRGLQLLT